MYKKIFTIVSCMVFVSLSGCALTTEHISLQYNQQQGVAEIPGARDVAVNVQVDDQRIDKSKVSCKKNGYGMEMAPILAVEDVTITIRKAIEQELHSRGYKTGSDTALVQIKADLTRFYNDHKMGFFAGDAVADLAMNVTVKSKSGETMYSRQLVSQGIEKNTQIAGAENARLALNQALGNGMKSLFEDQAFLSALLALSTQTLTSK